MCIRDRSILSEQDDRTMQMSDLAGLGFSSLSRLSHVVARLEREGLVTRERLPGKGRRTNAILTDAGFERVVAAAPLHVEAVRRFLIDALTQGELEALASIGDKVMLRIDPEQGPIPRR